MCEIWQWWVREFGFWHIDFEVSVGKKSEAGLRQLQTQPWNDDFLSSRTLKTRWIDLGINSIDRDPVWNHHIVNYVEGTQWRVAYNEGINRDLGSGNYEASSNLPCRTDLGRV